jgi:hypothetical protein
MDAGDWDRRVQHLKSGLLLLELAELFPDYFGSLSLNIPESGNGLPDVVNEALWNIDFFRRLQTAAGGIRGGIESSEHPRRGEAGGRAAIANPYGPKPGGPPKPRIGGRTPVRRPASSSAALRIRMAIHSARGGSCRSMRGGRPTRSRLPVGMGTSV